MPVLVELAASIVSTHCAMTELTTEELLRELQLVYTTLGDLETGGSTGEEKEETAPSMTAKRISLKKAFQADEVVCMICGKGGMKTLSRHLGSSHGMTPGEYRKQFNTRTQALTAKNLSESRRQMATERGLAEALARARNERAGLATKGKKVREAGRKKSPTSE